MAVQELLSWLLGSVQLSSRLSWVPSAFLGASQILLSTSTKWGGCTLPNYYYDGYHLNCMSILFKAQLWEYKVCIQFWSRHQIFQYNLRKEITYMQTPVPVVQNEEHSALSVSSVSRAGWICTHQINGSVFLHMSPPYK